jgi:hypothetical protein
MLGRRGLGRMVSVGSAVCLVVGCLVFLGVTGSNASSTTYYVDNTASCPGSGTQTSPWCDFSIVDSTSFQPGDQILLKRGDTFTSGMVLFGSGTPTSTLTVGAYGSGPSPIIDGDDNESFIGINLYNNSYVEVEGLTIEGAGSGILINDVTNQTGYTFSDLYLSGDGEGIKSTGSSNAGVASHVLVQDVVGTANTLSCSSTIDPCDGATLDLGGVSDVIVDRLYSSGSCGATGWGLAPGSSNIVIENSESIDDAACVVFEGTTANYIDDDTNVTYVNDMITDVPPAGAVDLSGIDVEPEDGPDVGINIEDDYIADNAGPGLEILDHPTPITNLDVSGNVFWDNAVGWKLVWTPYPVWGQIWTGSWLSPIVEATGSIDDNLYDAPTGTGGFETTHALANFSEMTQSNNLDVSGAHNVWYAANGFSCSTQGANGWSYQSSANNSTWTNFSGCTTVETLDNEWSTGGTASGFVSNFEELPSSTQTSWVARSWTAPTSGSVSIRGRVLMSNPACDSGATAEITENGSSNPIWGPTVLEAGDDVGVDTNLDGVSVKAGDVLHFAVQENGSSQCRVSWTPSVAIPNPVTTVLVPSGGGYVSGTQILDAAASDSASPISQVQYVLTGGSLNDAVIATGSPTRYGEIASWNTASVPDGSYTLQSVVTDAAGNSAFSPGVAIKVHNDLSTSLVLPTNGSSVSGSQVVLDAAAADDVGVTGVQFELTGGSLNDAVIATATPSGYGWLATWDSTTVPDGTYTLQSVASDVDGVQKVSSASTVVVENAPPPTSILVPSNGASVSGTQVVFDAGSPNVGVTTVKFELTGGSLNDAVVATATPSGYGWVATWDSTTVPNGTYTLQSVASDGAGYQGVSPAITVVVENAPPPTSILVPSNGASVSGTQVVFDAGSPNVGVTTVKFELTGGSLNDVVVATATPTHYGWVATWDSTTVPDGTYTLQSVASDAGGNEGVSPAISVTVDN